MPYTTVSTRSSGYKILASDWNDVINNENWLGNADRCVAVTDTRTSSIANATSTVLTFATDDYDTGGFHSTVSNTSRLTVPTGYGGIYNIFATVNFTYAGAVYPLQLELRKNAAASASGGTRIAAATGNTTTNAATMSSIQIFTQVRLAATDYVELFAQQDTGGALTMQGTTQAHRFGMTWISL